jgi:hypothetical protein
MSENFSPQSPQMPLQPNAYDPGAIPPTPDHLGLPQDANLVVRRSNGEMDAGWTAAAAKLVTSLDGKPVDFVIVRKPYTDPQGNARYLEKTVKHADLISWQPQPEDPAEANTLPRIPKINWYEAKATEQPVNQARGVSGFAIQGAMQQEASAQPVEKERNPRLEQIFAPLPKKDHLKSLPKQQIAIDVGQGQEEYSKQQWEADRVNRIRKDVLDKIPQETEFSRRNSVSFLGALQSRDHKAAAILGRYKDEFGIKDDDRLVDLVRSNVDLRYELGSYFLDKIQAHASEMSDRVRRNTQKNPNHRTWRHLGSMGSRAYASLIALSMLDGTFIDPDHDPVEYDDQGKVKLGHHRDAAFDLLTIPEK